MKKDICFILLFLFVTASSAFAQLIGFESSEVPEAFKTSGKGEAKISSLFYKEGKSSLEWDFQSGSTLNVQIPPLSLKGKTERQYGITLWIYNEKPQQDSIRFEFLNKERCLIGLLIICKQQGGGLAGFLSNICKAIRRTKIL
jgi:chondroitin-sulfate-ABC endolyase/exolyase